PLSYRLRFRSFWRCVRGARTTDVYTLSLHDALPIWPAKNVILIIGDGMGASEITIARNYAEGAAGTLPGLDPLLVTGRVPAAPSDRKSTRLNSSHVKISYAVFCLKKKNHARADRQDP